MFSTVAASNNTVIAFNESSDILLLISAIKNGDFNTAKAFLESNPNLDLDQRDNEGNNALITAYKMGHTEMVQLLLANGANINAQDKNGWTILMMAAYKGHTKIVRSLLANGANINAQNKDQWTALMIAAYKGHTETVQLLLERGAKTDTQNKDQWTALMISHLYTTAAADE